ncbi:MAG: bifunctional demethylmenaquinone methyltransferase/2-methoxy-6-polyprenyl-1,4-benzoquinol methylase UbiE [Bacteroidales bacterium]|nr:bifunctional demethylmenaquinone methyltransferase/2-methoxy-6-polyprenyl-1,4-benzoquinol methylase UbiE [Bacteroidales bacterium]
MSSSKKEQVRSMFNHIAYRYDFLNHFLSLGIDKSWRRKTVNAIGKHNPKYILDVATGTGDLAIELLKINPDKITGIDISEEMLRIAKKKTEEKNISHKIDLMIADCEQLPFPDNSFHAASIGFGIRNFENPQKGLDELFRVLDKNGTLAILEFSIPSNKIIKSFYLFYFKNILPMIGRLFSKNKMAYHYLPQSVEAFPYGGKFIEMLEKSGFQNTHARPLSFGIATLYTCNKP